MIALTLGMGLLSVGAAAADPVVTPGGSGDTGTVGTVITVPGAPGGSGGGGGGGGGSGQPVGSTGPAPCSYTTLTPEQAIVAGLAVPDGGGAENLATGGSFVMRDCSASGGARVIMWVPDATGGPPPAGVVTVTSAMLAQEARNLLQLPAPVVGVSPDGESANPALVNLPTWWWVDNDGTLTQRTAVGPVWAEVTATPYATSWVASDGAREDCPTLGVAWESWMSESQSGSCRFTYTQATESETATVETVWRVTWAGSGGTGGELDPMRVSTPHTMPVYERQAIVTGD